MPTLLADLITAEEFAARADDGLPSELVRGRIVQLNVPKPLHGRVCFKIALLVGNFVEKHQLGWMFSNDSGIITERGPDTIRGPDLTYVSYQRLPKDALPRREYLEVIPELVFEVRSPDDRWSQLMAKVSEYLEAGVRIVCVFDATNQFALINTPDDAPRRISGDDLVEFPSVLDGFSVPVEQFFS